MRRILPSIFIAIIIISSIILDFFFLTEHEGGEFWWSHIIGFFLVLGFVGSVVLVVVSKLLDHHWLGRKEDYYD